MSSDLLTTPRLHTQDLHTLYSTYLGHFTRHSIPFHTHSYASYFLTFEGFLSFGWGCCVVVDRRTGRGSVAVRVEGEVVGVSSGGQAGGKQGSGGTIQQFVRMIKVRFGESLPKLPNQLPITPSETSTRPLRIISDLASYKRLAATIPLAELNAKRKRLRAGEVGVCGEVWRGRQHNFLALDLTWWEKGNGVVLEAGVCACRCRNIDAMDAWPPLPDENYRRAHYVVSEWLDKRTNTNHYMPSQPRSYAHGQSQLVSMSALEKILYATISSLAEPEHDGPNTLIILCIGDTARLGEMKNVHIPTNVMFIDVSNLERSLYRASLSRQNNQQESTSTPLSLKGMLNQLGIPIPPHIPVSNSGNAAFYLMLVFQMLVDRDCQIPPVLQMPTQQNVPYPTMQIYPPAAGMPIMPGAQPGFARSSSPGRGHRSSLFLDSSAQQFPLGNGATMPPNMRRSQTMYWEGSNAPAIVTNSGHNSGGNTPLSQEPSSGSGSGLSGTGLSFATGKDKPREGSKDRNRQEALTNLAGGELGKGIASSFSRMKLGASPRRGSEELPSAPARFLGSIGRSGSGR